MIGPLAYVGGKSRLANKIISRIPEHQTYVEPFAGGAQIFFRKEPSEVEVLNDLDREVINFFRICQIHHQELVRFLSFTVVSREWYRLLQKQPPECLTDVQRAARFLYLQKNSFAGRVTRQNYAYHVIQPPNFDPSKIPELLEAVHKRFSRVQLECLPYEQVLDKYDRPQSFFLIDPPYWERTLYRFNFSAQDFQGLAAKLAKLKGKFIFTINDEKPIRQMFAEFHIEPVQLHYTSQKLPGRRYNELLIRNF